MWVQLDLTTDSVKEWSRETITALVRRGRWKGGGEKEVSFLLPFIPRTSLYHASLVNINRRLRDVSGLVRI